MNRTRTSKNAKRLLVWLLLLTMVFSLLPMAAFADEAGEPVVSEEPVQEPEPSSEPSTEPSQEPETLPEPEQPGDADVTIEGDEEQPEDEMLAEDEIATQAVTIDGYEYSIVMVDCGRRYFTVGELNQIIDAASDAGMHYVMLAVGNDGLRFLLDNMEFTVNGVTYSHKAVTDAIKKGNDDYAVFEKNALTQSEMNTIMNHACEKGVEIIPLINTPGHMDAILSAANALTGVTCNYSTSERTIDVTNETATAFTKALLQKYIEYFAACGCTMFSMGADEYGNDIGKTPHFSDLISSRQYTDYIKYLNDVADLINKAGMKPMAFNDGIYYNEQTDFGTIDPKIIVCYWSCGYGSYKPASAEFLKSKGFNLVNTHGDWYWVLGGVQCSTEKANQFDPTVFMGSNISSPVGAMFCIWCDEPTASLDLSKPIESLKVFGTKLPKTDDRNVNHGVTGTTPDPEPTTPVEPSPEPSPDETVRIKVGETSTDYTPTGKVDDPAGIKTDDETIAKATVTPGMQLITSLDDLSSGTYYISANKDDKSPSLQITIEKSGSSYYLKSGDNYIYPNATYGYNGWSYAAGTASRQQYSVKINTKDGGFTFSRDVSTYYFGRRNTTAYLTISGGKIAATSTSTPLYLYSGGAQKTTVSFTGVSAGTTYCTVGDTLYKIIVDYKQETVNAFVGGTKTVEGVSGELDTTELNTGVATVTLAGNVLTITGVGEGTTSVIVGNTKYTIVVTKEDLTKVTPLSIEYWITNGRVVSNGLEELSVSADENTASDNGVAVSELVPGTGVKEGTRTEYYWRCRLLDKTLANNSTSGTEEQQAKAGDDDTLSGVGFTRVRYYNGTWAVYTENHEWVNVESKYQLVAYYREKVEVTDEVDSYAADFGNMGDGSVGGAWMFDNLACSISYQVVYPDGTNPAGTTADYLKSKTVVYGYSENRGVGTLMFAETKDYEIYKVTAETGAMEGEYISSGSLYNVSSLAWDNNEKTVWTEDDGKTPEGEVVIQNNTSNLRTDDPYDNLLWNENYEAILIRIYVRAKVTADSLTVHYIDQDTGRQFYFYNIAVSNGVTFDPSFARTADGKLTGNTVTNIGGKSQTVPCELSEIKEVGAQYKYADYKFVDANRDSNGKDVYLYYTFTREKTFVVDFGIPLVITAESVNKNLAKANITGIEVATNTLFAKLKTDVDTSATPRKANVIYELNKTLDDSDTFAIHYSGEIQLDDGLKHDSIDYSVEIIPASNVYYEDGFAKFNGGQNTASKAKWEVVGKETTAYQALSELGNKNSQNIYGYDNAYKNSTMFSMGSAHKVTVTSTMRDGWNELSAWPTAKFSFKGTGFDVISLTNNTSGAILVDVYNSANEKVKGYFVDNYFGYGKNDVGEWVKMPDGGDNILYQIPVIKVSDLTYDNYNVTITVFYNDAFEHNGDSSYEFWLDAIRVYEPLGPSGNDSYTVDGEGYPQYIRLHDEIVKEGSSVGTSTLFIEGEKEADVAGYTNLGPNNEVYLANGQAISFKLSTNNKIDKVQIGAKAPTGTTGMTVNKDTESKVEITSATEMYYDITTVAKDGQVTITNNTGNILSLTNIKVTFSEESEVTLVALDDAAKENAVEIVRTLFAARVVEPEKTFEPSRFKATWSKNVRAGERAVLTVKTSEDVESITVNGVPVTTYKTRTERTGWGRNAQRVTYREFTYMISAAQNADYTVIAVNAEGTSSAPQIASLNVIPARPTRPGWGWLEDLFGRWF